MQVNRHRGEVMLSLGAKALVLRPSFDAICRMETATGYGVIALAQRLCDGSITAAEIALMIEQCQWGEGVCLSREEVGSLLVRGGITEAIASLVRMLESVLSGIGHES